MCLVRIAIVVSMIVVVNMLGADDVVGGIGIGVGGIVVNCIGVVVVRIVVFGSIAVCCVGVCRIIVVGILGGAIDTRGYGSTCC